MDLILFRAYFYIFLYLIYQRFKCVLKPRSLPGKLAQTQSRLQRDYWPTTSILDKTYSYQVASEIILSINATISFTISSDPGLPTGFW